MGNCCYCCLDEGQKVAAVLQNFLAKPLSTATLGQIEKLIGRISLVGNRYAYAPGSGKPCVYYKTVVQEERRNQRWVEDEHGGHMQVYETWETICTREDFMDFYLQDGAARLYIPASDRKSFKVEAGEEGMTDAWYGFRRHEVPPGIQMLICQHQGPGWNWDMFGSVETATGNFRYSERCLEWNEQLAVFGKVMQRPDPYSGQTLTSLAPYDPNALDEKFFKDNKWQSHAISAWKEFAKTPCVLISDNRALQNNVQVPPINEYPPPCDWNQQVFQFQDNWQHSMWM